MFEKLSEEWVGTPLDADRIDPLGIAEITVEFDEGEEVPHPHGGSGSKVLGRAGH